MSWVRIWIHLVFTTKNRASILHADIRAEIFNHIKQNAVEKNIWVDCVNGFSEHVHILFSLNKDQTLSNVVQLVKGESSYWINKNKIISEKFSWQDDYWAVGVSESHVNSVRNYIHNQAQHHKNKTYAEEIEEFMKKYGWKYVKG
jgi:putative transposase